MDKIVLPSMESSTNPVQAMCSRGVIDKFYDYLYYRVPLDVMVLYLCDLSKAVMFLYNVTTDQGAVSCFQRRKLTNETYVEYKQILPKKTCHFSVEKSPAAKEFLADFPIPQPFAAINVHTKVRQSVYACVGLCSRTISKYTAAHENILIKNYTKITTWLRDILGQLEIRAIQNQLASEKDRILRRVEYLGKASIVGADGGLKETLELAKRVAPLNSTVLITGETGSGKEVLANAIHRMSPRAGKPFVSVNCGAIPETLLDSELFGHEKGAFTDAHTMREGFFEQADGGSIFLDEIGELSHAAQVKLLRLLQTMKFFRVGGTHPQSVDVRVLAATNRDLAELSENGLFRSDLLYRLNVYPIHVPPLRERKIDIPRLAVHFARYKAREMALPWKPVVKDSAIAQLQQYDWPGNVRELQNVIERSLILSNGKPLKFPTLYATALPSAPSVERSSGQSLPEEFLSLGSVIKKHIQHALASAGGKIEGPGGAADLLNLAPSTLRAKMKKYGIVR